MKKNRLFTLAVIILIFTYTMSCTFLGAGDDAPTLTPNMTLTAVYAAGGEMDATPTDIILPSPTNTLQPVTQAPTSVSPTNTPEVPDDGDGPTDTPIPVSTSTPAPPTATYIPTIVFTPTAFPTSDISVLVPEPTPVDGVIRRPDPSVIAVYFYTPPVIDGDYSDWTSITYTAQDVVYGEGYYVGLSDVLATFQVGWDSNYLYIGADVLDNKFVQTTYGEDMYKGDSIEILVDTALEYDYPQETISLDDYQFGFSPGDFFTSPPEIYLWYPTSKTGWFKTGAIAAVQTETGYRIEAAIPWSTFGLKPVVGQRFGFAFAVSDNDAAGQEHQQTMISNVPTRFFYNPTTWGDLVLMAP